MATPLAMNNSTEKVLHYFTLIYKYYYYFAEVVQRKSPRQVEQPGVVWQGYIWKTVQRSTTVQADHTRRCLWKVEGSRLPRKESTHRA